MSRERLDSYKYLPFDPNQDEISIHLLFRVTTIFDTTTILSKMPFIFRTHMLTIVTVPFDTFENVF